MTWEVTEELFVIWGMEFLFGQISKQGPKNGRRKYITFSNTGSEIRFSVHSLDVWAWENYLIILCPVGCASKGYEN